MVNTFLFLFVINQDVVVPNEMGGPIICWGEKKVTKFLIFYFEHTQQVVVMATKRDRKTAFPFIKPKGSIKKDVQQYRWVHHQSRGVSLSSTSSTSISRNKQNQTCFCCFFWHHNFLLVFTLFGSIPLGPINLFQCGWANHPSTLYEKHVWNT